MGVEGSPTWRSEEEYIAYLRSRHVSPRKRHRITITVSELELNALEDLLYVDLTPEERTILEKIVERLWRRLVRTVDRKRKP